jgi:REP element-mobilizing transposase RayT
MSAFYFVHTSTMRSFASCLLHCVFTTKHREPWLTPDIRARLWPYLAGIAREHQMCAMTIGGVGDHVHVLLSIPTTVTISKALQLLKGNSSKWIHETFPGTAAFNWQSGYGAFSIGVSGVEATTRYIKQQEAHHRTRSFRDEFVIMLRKHKIKFEDWMLDDDSKVGG